LLKLSLTLRLQANHIWQLAETLYKSNHSLLSCFQLGKIEIYCKEGAQSNSICILFGRADFTLLCSRKFATRSSRILYLVDFWLSCFRVFGFIVPKILYYLAFQSFDFEYTRWWFFQTRVVGTKFDIYVLIVIILI
jgi:hypothetical protein